MIGRPPHSPCRRTDHHDAHEFEVYGRPFWCPGYSPTPQPPADQTALRDRIAEAALAAVEATLGDTLLPAARAEALAGIAAALPASIDRAAVPSVVVRKTLRRWAYAAGHIESELDGAVDRMYELVARDVRRRVADETATTETQAAVPVCICGHPKSRHFEDVCQTCGCGDYLEPRDAAEVIDRWRQAALKARAEAAAQQDVAVDTLARLMCDADVHVNNGDYPGWDDLSKTPGLGQDEVRKAARYLLKRLHITERQPAAGARQDGAATTEAQAECTASRTGACLREAESETACDTEAGECAHGGQPAAGARQDGARP
ncbi:hypothetical protein [Streptomyces sp. EKS3.2]|uniref:hypothetical protein n=1 Tax=Streptomyces sp. EKS3.2 TaxID=3461008 RepID=UPI0040424412